MVEDVTVPDNTPMSKGQKFTKTWRFMNNGKCNWSGYTIAFFAGDRMETPDSVPVPDTPAGQTVDVSVELTAPSIDVVPVSNEESIVPSGLKRATFLLFTAAFRRSNPPTRIFPSGWMRIVATAAR